jgi:hypothetical protein
MSEETLPGGLTDGAVRIAGVVHKRASPWTAMSPPHRPAAAEFAVAALGVTGAEGASADTIDWPSLGYADALARDRDPGPGGGSDRAAFPARTCVPATSSGSS